MAIIPVPHHSEPLVDRKTGRVTDTWLRYFNELSDDPLRYQNGSLTLANGVNSNVILPRARFITITGPTGAFSISGFAVSTPVEPAREVILYNPTAFAMTLTDDATSTAANRILTMTGGDVATTGTGTARLIYSTVSSRWVLVGLQT